MNLTDRQRTLAADDLAESDKALTELLDVLTEQVSSAKRGKIEKVSSLIERVEQLLSRVSRGVLRRQNEEKVNRTWRLYNELCLTLEAQKSELAEELERLRTGRNSLRGYRDALA